jgi:YNFM family putative membrane transporter
MNTSSDAHTSNLPVTSTEHAAMPSKAQADVTAATLPDGVQRGTPEYRRIAIALFLAGFSTFSLLYCVQPLLPEFAAEFQVGPAASSLALSLTTGCLAIAIFCAGAFSEGAGRRGLMFVSMMLGAVLNLVAAFSPNWPTLLVARALEGLVLGGVPAVAMAYLAEEIDHRSLGFAMGLYVGGTAFGGMIGRVGMSLLTDLYSWRTAMAAVGVIDLLAAIGFLLLLPPSRRFVRKRGVPFSHHVAAWRGHLLHRGLPLLFLSAFLVMGVFVTIYNYAGFRLIAAPYSLSQTQIGLIFSAYLAGMVASPAAGALADRFGRAPVLITGILTAALGVVLTLAAPLSAIIVGVVLLTIRFFMSHSVASAWVGRMGSAARGHASSLYLLAYYLGSSVLGSVGGWFWEHGAWPAITGFSLVLLALTPSVALTLRYLVQTKAVA